jgi:hypothetical protein
MAKFVIGLIIGIFLGALAAAYQPTLPAGLREALADVTTLVARGTEQAAESVDRAAGRMADEAKRSGQGTPEPEPAPPPAPAPDNGANR